jgi:hypothetical protein
MSSKDSFDIDDIKDIDNLDLEDFDNSKDKKKEDNKQKEKQNQKEKSDNKNKNENEEKDKNIEKKSKGKNIDHEKYEKEKIFEDMKKIYNKKDRTEDNNKNKKEKKHKAEDNNKNKKEKEHKKGNLNDLDEVISKDQLNNGNNKQTIGLLIILFVVLILVIILFLNFDALLGINGIDLNTNADVNQDLNISDQNIEENIDLNNTTNEDTNNENIEFEEFDNLNEFKNALDNCNKGKFLLKEEGLEVPSFNLTSDTEVEYIIYGKSNEDKCVVYYKTNKLEYYLTDEQFNAMKEQGISEEQINEQLSIIQESVRENVSELTKYKIKCLLDSENNFISDRNFTSNSYSINLSINAEGEVIGNGYTCVTLNNSSQNINCNIRTLSTKYEMSTGTSINIDVFGSSGSSEDLIWDYNAESIISLDSYTGDSVKMTAINPGVVNLRVSDLSVDDSCYIEQKVIVK